MAKAIFAFIIACANLFVAVATLFCIFKGIRYHDVYYVALATFMAAASNTGRNK